MIEERMNGSTIYKEYFEGPPERTRRICALSEVGSDEEASRLSLNSLRIRFGKSVITAEGLGGVRTLPGYRGKGYATILMKRAMASVSSRANAAFLYGIEGLYEKSGFASCLRESSLSMWTGRIRAIDSPAGFSVNASGGSDDLYEIIALYNAAHRYRPWTVVRTPEASSRFENETPWRPAPEILTVRRGDIIAGYAAVSGMNYGSRARELTVLEAAVADTESGVALLLEIGRRCGERDISEFTILEPSDGVLGNTAFRLGATEKSESSPDGGGMAAVVNRGELVEELSGELLRRHSEAYRWLGVPQSNPGTNLARIVG
ncbi:MAG: GNAT family N-acetyltransferase, partial [Spirochaetales bacterium]|nr:GNAT family N-acetyltransferase [Spirochaetales bacterium]